MEILLLPTAKTAAACQVRKAERTFVHEIFVFLN